RPPPPMAAPARDASRSRATRARTSPFFGAAHGRWLSIRLCPRQASRRGMTRFALLYQSVISDWNHGNAHFLRGLMRALQARGHDTVCYEQADNWSLSNLLETNPHAIEDFADHFPDLRFARYSPGCGVEDWLRQRL